MELSGAVAGAEAIAEASENALKDMDSMPPPYSAPPSAHDSRTHTHKSFSLLAAVDAVIDCLALTLG